MKSTDIKKITDELTPLFKNYEYIASVYLYGSTALGTSNILSDVDLALLLKQKAPSGLLLLDEILILEYKIQTSLGVNNVDLVVLNNQGMIFQHTVIKTGRLIYENDPQYRKKFETKVILDYCDFEPTLRLIEKYHLKGRLRRCGIK